MLRRFASGYFAGGVAACVASLALWIAGRADLTATIGVKVAPALTWAWLAPRVLAGSLWGLALPLALRRGARPVRAGLALSLLPSLATLFFFLPQAGHGMLGSDLGTLTPLVVLAEYALWGWILALVSNRVGL